MKSAIILFALVAVALAFTEEDYSDAFSQWMKDNNKVYASEEFQTRYNAFKSNMDYVEKWNNEGSSTILGLTQFADLTNEEYRQIYLGFAPKTPIVLPAQTPEVALLRAVPAAIDWRKNGTVTPIKNQGSCGSCWSFSTTGSVEGQHKLATGNLVSLSEQNLMDCSFTQGDEACNGGLMDDAFKYIIANKGIDTEASYPYTGKTSKVCKYSAANIGATISSYKDVTANSETDLMNAVGTVGPVSVAIDASHLSFQLYKTGVYYEKICSETKLDHGVLAVGYGTDATHGDYWIVKNSWGTTWGQEGYIWMSRGKNNNCGIATSASYPIV